MSKITDEQKAEFRAVRAEVAALVERLNAILVETSRDYRAHLKFKHITPLWPADDDGGADDGDALDRPRGRIGSERGEREDESGPLPADDEEGA